MEDVGLTSGVMDGSELLEHVGLILLVMEGVELASGVFEESELLEGVGVI